MTSLPEAAKCFISLRKSVCLFPFLFREDKINVFVLLCLLCFLLSYVYFSAYARSILNTSEARFTAVIGNCNFCCVWFQSYLLISLECLLQCCGIQIWPLDLMEDDCKVDVYPYKRCCSCNSTLVELLNTKSLQSWVLLLYHPDTYFMICFDTWLNYTPLWSVLKQIAVGFFFFFF